VIKGYLRDEYCKGITVKRKYKLNAYKIRKMFRKLKTKGAKIKQFGITKHGIDYYPIPKICYNFKFYYFGIRIVIEGFFMGIKIKCPDCIGFGKNISFHGNIIGNCKSCEGSGTIKKEKIPYLKYGKYLYKYRINKLKLTLRQAAKKYNIDPSNLSKMERGIIRPKNIYKK
jgi:hypothetical protein